MTQDRGNGSPEVVFNTVSNGLSCAFIMPTHLMNYYPFCSQTMLNKSKASAVFIKAGMGGMVDSAAEDSDDGTAGDHDTGDYADIVDSEVRRHSEDWVISDEP